MTSAIAQEWIVARRGSERVFEGLAAVLADAQLFALSADPGHGLQLQGRPLTTTYLDTAHLRSRRQFTLPLMADAWRRLAVGRRFDLLVVSHHSMATQFARHCRADARMAYVHSPARYVWSPELDGRGSNPLLQPVRRLLQRSDRRAVDSLDSIVANSLEVADRINRYWGRSAAVIPPPVDTAYFTPELGSLPSRDYVLGVSRFVPYKRLDLVIDAGEAAGIPVVLAGSGPDEARLRARAAAASVPVTFVLDPGDGLLRSLYRNARCLVFLAHEDFGIVAVEAQACGTPVVGRTVGGTIETVADGITGHLLPDLDPGALADAIARTESIDPVACVEWAAQFSHECFGERVSGWLGKTPVRR